MARKAPKPEIVHSAEVVREYGPFPGGEEVHGVTFDGENVWFAAGTKLQSFDPTTGEPRRALPMRAEAGTAWDGRHLYQLAGDRILKIDPESGAVVTTLPAPGNGRDAGLTWAEGTLWVGQYRDRTIHQIDATTGRVLRTLSSARFVTGVTWLAGELWHATWEDDQSDLRHLDPESGDVVERVVMPADHVVTGLESDGRDVFFCGGGKAGKIRAIRRPRRAP